MKFLLRPFLAVAIVANVAPAAVFTATGSAPGDIQSSVDSFRAALGANNGSGGSFATGRREISWDGVSNNFADPNALPADFFNVNFPRGVVFSGAASFLVSSSLASGVPVEFGNLNAGYPAEFQTFSAERLFTATGGNSLIIDFLVPGTNTPASVLGFGAVFTDVEIAGGTKYTVFYANGDNGGQFAVPVSPSGGLSFLGLTDPVNRYSRIIIQFGTLTPGQTENLGQNLDAVAMDDFIYGEPLSEVPEPSSIALVGLGVAAAFFRRRKR
jgi:PEP-CTERM motif